MSSQNAELLEAAREIGKAAPGWADFANALYDQNGGLLANSFHSPEERAAFVLSDEYRQIKALVRQAQERSGLVQGPTPTKSGKLLVRIPKSMHEAPAFGGGK